MAEYIREVEKIIDAYHKQNPLFSLNAGEQTHFIIAVWAFALFAKLLHPFPCLGVYDRLVVVLENHLLFRGIFYTVLDFVRKFIVVQLSRQKSKLFIMN